MSDESNIPKGQEVAEEPLDARHLAARVYNSLQRRNRERTSEEAILRLIGDLDLSEPNTRRRVPRLRIDRLVIKGEKHLHGQEALQPIHYDQRFGCGVNVLLIPNNGVGKSSVLKTIKYVLTGDNDGYDNDVRGWLHEVRLEFCFDDQPFTMLLAVEGAEQRGIMVGGRFTGSLHEAAASHSLEFEARGSDAIKADLQRFFFHHLDLTPLSWMQDDPSAPTGSARRSTSWLTYFQALLIPDDDDRYLLCDPQHAMGNQEGLILSTFLGLRLVQPLNELSVEASRIRKDGRRDQQQAERDAEVAIKQRDTLTAEAEEIRATLRVLDREQRSRRTAVEQEGSDEELERIRHEIDQRSAEISTLILERDQLTQLVQEERTRARRLRQAVALKQHFTGIEVTLCPNCDNEVGEDDIQRELADHLCRVCGKPSHAADSQELALMEEEASQSEAGVAQFEEQRNAANSRLATLRASVGNLRGQIETLREASRRGLDYALPTPEEEQRRQQLNQRLGAIQAHTSLAEARIEAANQPQDEAGLRERILVKVREELREQAQFRNEAVLQRLAILTQEVVALIGAESISDISVSPLGKVTLKKNDVSVAFSSINNQGDRLRMKLAFFLTMMRLGREPGLGRHPGFLLIDSPGSAEMATEDLVALARVFRQVDTDLSEEVQILCFTAQQAFGEAAAPSKVYGPQAGIYAF